MVNAMPAVQARSSRRTLRSLPGDDRGAATVSFILTLPVFWFIIVLLVQFVLIANAKIAVRHATYVAARSAVTSLPENRPQDVRTAAAIALSSISPAGFSTDLRAYDVQRAFYQMGVGPSELAGRFGFASRATTVTWNGSDNRSTEPAAPLTVQLDYRFSLSVPIAQKIIGSFGIISGVPGYYTDIHDSCTLTCSPGRSFGNGMYGWTIYSQSGEQGE